MAANVTLKKASRAAICGWIAASVVVLALLILLRDTVARLLLLALLSATIAYLVLPIAKRLPFSRGAATGVALGLIAAGLAALLFFGVPALIRQLGGLKESLPGIVTTATQLLTAAKEALYRLGIPPETVAGLEQQTGDWMTKAAGLLAQGAVNVGNAVASSWYLALSPLLAFYMVRDREKLFNGLLRLIPARVRRRTMSLGYSIKRDIGAYVRGQLTVSLITGSLTAIGLAFIGLPSWLVMGLLMILFNLIPYFGPVLGAIPILIFSVPMGFKMVLLALLVVFLAQQIESMVVAPRIIGKAASLHPVMVMLALLVGGWVCGLAGMFFSIPFCIALRATLMAVKEELCRHREDAPAA